MEKNICNLEEGNKIKMKIVSFTMVNNESEIIESFIRYNYNFIDEMVVIDNGCTDNTIKIVNELIKEGFKIKVYDESLEAYNQYRLDNKYLNKIINELTADLIQIIAVFLKILLIINGKAIDILHHNNMRSCILPI